MKERIPLAIVQVLRSLRNIHAQTKLHAGQNETVDKHDDHEKGLLFPQDTLG
jgi:hypothetical protein